MDIKFYDLLKENFKNQLSTNGLKNYIQIIVILNIQTHKDSTEDLVVGSKTLKGDVTNYWRLNTVDKIASWGYGNKI